MKKKNKFNSDEFEETEVIAYQEPNLPKKIMDMKLDGICVDLGFKDKKPLAFSVYRAITHFFSDKDGKQVVVKLEEPILIKTLLESHLKDLRNRKKKNDKNKKS